MKAIPLMAALIGIVAITGCSYYEGDSPEAAMYKAKATCMAAAFEHAKNGSDRGLMVSNCFAANK